MTALDAPATTLSTALIEQFLRDEVSADALPEPAWGPLGKVVYQRTYSRDIYLKRTDGSFNLDDQGNRIAQPWWTWSLPAGDRSVEVWGESCRRIAMGNVVLDKTLSEDEQFAEAVELFNLLYTFKYTPAGRHLWVTGTPSPFTRNCWSAPFGPHTSDHFRFGASRLFEGGGVGSNYSIDQMERTTPIRSSVTLSILCSADNADFIAVATAVALHVAAASQDVEQIELITELASSVESATADAGDKAEAAARLVSFATASGVLRTAEARADAESKGETLISVEDSREGWVDAWCNLIDLSTDETPVDVILDVDKVRPFGAPLKTFGGTASGPAPLVTSALRTVDVLNDAAADGRRLSGLEAMLIDHEIAHAVVAGGARRSARMSLMSWDSPEIFDFIICKADYVHHWTTNISVEINDAFRAALDAGDEHATAVYEAITLGMVTNGEPGIIDTGVMNRDREAFRGNEIRHVNPCLSGDTLITTPEGQVAISDLVGRGKVKVQIGNVAWETDDRGFFRTGFRDLVKVSFAMASGETYEVRCTPEHQILVTSHDWPGEERWVEARHLTPEMYAQAICRGGEFCDVEELHAHDAQFVSRVADGTEDVFDASVPGPNAFFANGVYVHNCGEAQLETEPGDGQDVRGSGESCNLGSVNLDAFGTDFDGARRAFEVAGRFLYRSTFKPYGDETAARIEDRNRRIGAGFYGFQGWLAAHGRKMSEFPEDVARQDDLSAFKQAAYEAACVVADANGTPRPITATVVAPTGSIAQLSGATSGINPVYSPYFLRRVRFGASDPAWREAQAAGYIVEKDIYADNTMVVEYPTRDAILDRYDESLIEGSFDIDFGTYMRIVAAVQTSFCGGERGQAVSHTAQLEANTDPSELAKALRPLLGTLKGVTAFPAVSRPMSPLEAISKEDFVDYTQFREATTSDSNDGSCATGACPTK